MRNYVALTIGPVFETISGASTPGALWCASGLFSRLAGDLCASVTLDIPDAQIIAPAYDPAVTYNDGVGRWHDRIFFSSDLTAEGLKEKLQTICTNTKDKIANHIHAAILFRGDALTRVQNYIRDYIQIHWLIAPEAVAHANGHNCILNLSGYLDSMELTSGFVPDDTSNPLTALFSGTEQSSNTYIKNCWLIPKGEIGSSFQLLNEGNIREINDIANPTAAQDGLRIRGYYAVVYSDGDNMGKALGRIPDDEAVRQFQNCCVEYAGEAASAIGDFGGLTIYAGGDDLLFLAPVLGKNDENILELCTRITQIFDRMFASYHVDGSHSPSLSFGISVNYIKYPLYEALEDARELLFNDAKSEQKNQLALAVHKRSGQSIKMILPNRIDEDSPISELSNFIRQQRCDAEKVLHSVLHTLNVYKSSFALCKQHEMDTQNLFDNLFDCYAHDVKRSYIQSIKSLGDSMERDGGCRSDGANGMCSDSVEVLIAMLWFAKLYTEKGV